MLDAAVQTLAEWSRGNDQNRWYYFPKELELQSFNPVFGNRWLPDLGPGLAKSWDEFRKEVDKHYRQQLKEYRKTVTQSWGADRKTLSQQAIWTVLYQRGMSPGRIRIWQPGPEHSLENILARVNKFAKSIGLTLRAQKSGRRRKI